MGSIIKADSSLLCQEPYLHTEIFLLEPSFSLFSRSWSWLKEVKNKSNSLNGSKWGSVQVYHPNRPLNKSS